MPFNTSPFLHREHLFFDSSQSIQLAEFDEQSIEQFIFENVIM